MVEEEGNQRNFRFNNGPCWALMVRILCVAYGVKMSAVLLGDSTYNTMSFEAMRLCYAAQSHVQVSHLMLVVDSKYCTGSLHLHTFTATCNHSPKSKNCFKDAWGKSPYRKPNHFGHEKIVHPHLLPNFEFFVFKMTSLDSLEWLPGRAWCLA